MMGVTGLTAACTMAQGPMPTPTQDQEPWDPPPSRHAGSNATLIFPLSLPEFFKFKGFGSLSSIPRSFTLRRVSVAPSSHESLGPGLPPPHGFLDEPFDSTQDDLNTMPKSPGPYARSSDMYSHMGTMPRLNLGKAGKSLGKAKSSQSCREKGTPRNKIPQTAPLADLESPEMAGTPDPGMDPPSAAGKAEQEKEEAPQDTPGVATARMDQEPVGNVFCPRTECSSLTPNSSPTPSPDTAPGVKTTDGDLPKKGQEHPSKSSPDRYGHIGFALASVGMWGPTFCLHRARGGCWDTVGSLWCSSLACSAGGMHLAGGTAQLEHSIPWSGQRLHGSEVSCGISAPSCFRTGWKYLSAPLSSGIPLSCRRLCSSTETCCRELRPVLSQPPPPLAPLFSTPSSFSPSPSSSASLKARGKTQNQLHQPSFHHLPVNPLSGHKPLLQAQPSLWRSLGSQPSDKGWLFWRVLTSESTREISLLHTHHQGVWA